MLGDPPPFAAPKLKIERAERHIIDLETTIEAFRRRDPNPVTIEDDHERGVRRLNIEIREVVPYEIGLIVGDAVHNLRSALDIMICDVAALFGDDSRKARFPFAEEADALESVFRPEVKKLPADILAMIKALKPYKKGGDKKLRGLHDLDVLDKHQVIITTADRVIIDHSEVGKLTLLIRYRRLAGAKEVLTFPLDGIVNENPEPMIQITFGYRHPFQGEPLLPTLVQLADLTKGIVQKFETHCLGQRLR
jgi:hypothetical protein